MQRIPFSITTLTHRFSILFQQNSQETQSKSIMWQTFNLLWKCTYAANSFTFGLEKIIGLWDYNWWGRYWACFWRLLRLHIRTRDSISTVF